MPAHAAGCETGPVQVCSRNVMYALSRRNKLVMLGVREGMPLNTSHLSVSDEGRFRVICKSFGLVMVAHCLRGISPPNGTHTSSWLVSLNIRQKEQRNLCTLSTVRMGFTTLVGRVWSRNLNEMQVMLTPAERLHYRDLLRSARYETLADAEGFESICFAVERLGMRLHGQVAAMGIYRAALSILANESTIFSELPAQFPQLFMPFDALFEAIRRARNDAMHTGVYARSITHKANELCLGLEDALMANGRMDDEAIVAHFMVRSPIIVEGWQPVAQARQLMLTYSISYLPWWNGEKWTLLSETSVLRYLRSARTSTERVGFPAKQLQTAGLDLIDAVTVTPDTKIDELLSMLPEDNASKLWLVVDNAIPERLLGVFTPFDLL